MTPMKLISSALGLVLLIPIYQILVMWVDAFDPHFFMSQIFDDLREFLGI